MSQKFVAACVQMRSGTEISENVQAASALIKDAHRAGAQFVATPEVTSLFEAETNVLFQKVQSEGDDGALKAFRALAQDLQVWLLIGSMPIRVSDSQCANRSFLIAPDGRVHSRYDKMHMFDVDLPNGETYRESKNFRRGAHAIVSDLPWGKVGLSVCYDLRFAYLYRRMAQAGASLLTVPAAFTHTTGQAHWHVLLRARAIETGCFVIAPAQGGHHANGRHTYGHSLIVDPWGKVLAEGGTDPGVFMAEIDFSEVQAARGRVPSLKHDREFTLLGGD